MCPCVPLCVPLCLCFLCVFCVSLSLSLAYSHLHSWHRIRSSRRPGRPLGYRLGRAGALAVKARNFAAQHVQLPRALCCTGRHPLVTPPKKLACYPPASHAPGLPPGLSPSLPWPIRTSTAGIGCVDVQLPPSSVAHWKAPVTPPNWHVKGGAEAPIQATLFALKAKLFRVCLSPPSHPSPPFPLSKASTPPLTTLDPPLAPRPCPDAPPFSFRTSTAA